MKKTKTYSILLLLMTLFFASCSSTPMSHLTYEDHKESGQIEKIKQISTCFRDGDDSTPYFNFHDIPLDRVRELMGYIPDNTISYSGHAGSVKQIRLNSYSKFINYRSTLATKHSYAIRICRGQALDNIVTDKYKKLHGLREITTYAQIDDLNRYIKKEVRQTISVRLIPDPIIKQFNPGSQNLERLKLEFIILSEKYKRKVNRCTYKAAILELTEQQNKTVEHFKCIEMSHASFEHGLQITKKIKGNYTGADITLHYNKILGLN